MKKCRLDTLLHERRLAESRAKAQRLIMAGQVRVNGQMVIKPAHMVDPAVDLSVDLGPRFVSRGGEKLEAALTAFHLQNLTGRVCVDVGASTGGFSDCLLQAGAVRVYAVDVGYGILHWKLRNDSRMVVMERTNARHITGFPESVDLVSIDASFISLKIILPVVKTWLEKTGGQVLALIKPQFEAGRAEAARGEGVIRSPALHRQILIELLNFAAAQGFGVQGLIRSPLTGPKGNIEFLVHLLYPTTGQPDITGLVEHVVGIPQDSILKKLAEIHLT